MNTPTPKPKLQLTPLHWVGLALLGVAIALAWLAAIHAYELWAGRAEVVQFGITPVLVKLIIGLFAALMGIRRWRQGQEYLALMQSKQRADQATNPSAAQANPIAPTKGDA